MQVMLCMPLHSSQPNHVELRQKALYSTGSFNLFPTNWSLKCVKTHQYNRQFTRAEEYLLFVLHANIDIISIERVYYCHSNGQ